MLQKAKKYLLMVLPAIIIALFMAGLVVYGWTEPGSTPPEGNVLAPINVGDIGQTKIGWLAISKNFFVGSEPNNDEKAMTNVGYLRTSGGALLNTGGSQNGLLVANGNVGIGTLTPGHRLSIVGGYKTTGLNGVAGGIHISGGGGTGISGQIVWGDNTGWKLHFGTSSNKNFVERMTISDRGLVGIGTTNPGATLEINNAINLSDNRKVENVGGIYIESTVDVSPAIVLSSSGIFAGGAVYLGQAKQANHGVVGSSPFDGVLGVSIGNNNYSTYRRLILATGAGGAEHESQLPRMTISSIRQLDNSATGIGINNLDPEATLDIRNIVSASENTKVENIGGVYLEADFDANTSPAIVLSTGGTQAKGSVYMGHARLDNHGGTGVKAGDGVIGTRGGYQNGTGNLKIVTGKYGEGQTVKMTITKEGLIKLASVSYIDCGTTTEGSIAYYQGHFVGCKCGGGCAWRQLDNEPR